MSKSDTFENDLLRLIFNGTPIANLADNAASAPLGSFYLALHTADPGEAGTQTTSECNYTGYARLTVARTAGGFTVTGNAASLVANADFAQPGNATNLPQTALFCTIGTALSGAGKVLYRATLSNPIVISNVGSIPRVQAGQVVTED